MWAAPPLLVLGFVCLPSVGPGQTEGDAMSRPRVDSRPTTD